ncbi:RHS repeat-associated core domain-containing protein [Frankia sp. AgB32]|uniref:RHS repeat-associated core domain-containing protein n=1 Tax=Frankia sp. AgB32 TaxID=631119 RepID=UPI00200BDDCB|nr:RHS repeat-associated core domain-containing protein [Frankia sp. AgB32]
MEIVDAAGALTRITVNDDDLPTCVVDPDGVTTRFRWDDDAQLIDVRVAGGGRTRLRYDAAGRLVGITGPAGQTRVWENDDAGRVVREQGPDGAASVYHYTAAGRPDGYVDPAGGRWGSTYGPHGRVEQVVDPLGSTLGFEYDLFGNTALIVAPDGQKFHVDHDGLGRLVALSDPAGATFRRGYDPDGRPSVESDAEGHEWRVEYDEAGRPVRRTSPDGRVRQRAYDPAGAIIADTDPAGTVTRYERDQRGRVRAVIDPLGGRRTLEWTPGGRLAAVTTPLGRRETYGYDRAGRWVQTTAPSGARTLYRRDAAGRLTALVTPAGRETTWEYDVYGRVAAVTRPGERRTTIERNPLGLPVVVTDGTGASRRYTYDARGALTSATDPLGALTRYEYDTRGQLAAWTDPLGGRHELHHDQVGRQTGMTDPLGRPTTVSRDRNGAVDTLRYADGTGLRWWRGPGGRLIGRGPAGSEQPWVRYSYDPAGRVTRAEPAGPAPDRPEPGGAVALKHDQLGRLIARTTAAGRLEWGYDADGQVVSARRTGAAPLRYDYDADGRLRSVEHPALGRRLLDRDADGRPVIPGHVVRRDAAGRIVQVDHDETRLRFSYDEAGQLVTAEGPWGRQTLTWDLGGRLIHDDRGDPATTVRSSYDAAGQLVERRVGDAPSTTFSYDPAGRRIAADGPSGTVRYRWDPAGGLAEIHHSPTSETREPGRTTGLAVDALGMPLQVNGVPVLWDPVTWPGQVHQFGTATYARAGSVIGVIDGGSAEDRPGQAGQRGWIDADGQDSPGSYDPWGLPTPSSADSPTGGPAEAAGGLGYHGELAVDGLLWQRARVLDPATRSFLSPDPLDHLPGMPAAANPYHYAWNDPVGMLDPTGLRPLSDDEYNTYRTQADKGMFDKAWDNIRHDPWGSLAAAAVIGAGVGLMFVPGGQAVGAGILIGAGASAGIGLVTGHFSPRSIAVSGIIGGAPGGIGDAIGGATTAGADALSADAAIAEDVGGLTNVFRVEGPGNERLNISPSGEVAIKGDNMLFLNFGQEARAQSFIERRLAQGFEGTQIKTFQVPTSYVDELRAAAVPESMMRQFPGSPLVVDVNQAVDQFGLRAAHFDDLLDNIIPGSGRFW